MARRESARIAETRRSRTEAYEWSGRLKQGRGKAEQDVTPQDQQGR